MTLGAFLKMGCGVEVIETCVTLGKNSSTPVASNSTSSQSVVRYLTRPQFSSFFGFSDERGKGVTYRVWRFEVDSAIQENLHLHEVIAEQIHKSLQGEAKTRIVGFGPGASVEEILEKFDQFYRNQSTAVGDELLSREQESQEVSTFGSRWITKSVKQKAMAKSYYPTKKQSIATWGFCFGRGSRNPLRIRPDTKRIPAKHSLIWSLRRVTAKTKIVGFGRGTHF